MMRPATRRFMAIAAFMLLSIISLAQPIGESYKTGPKPYRILTSGKQITVKSTKNIKNIMVWTASGHRIVEQKDLNLASYSFNTGSRSNVIFVMIQYEGQKPYTEKIGVH